jgi:hypothetical protein
VKSKRRRNLVKKAIELSSLCDLETILVVRDKKNRRITLYESSPKSFSLDKARDQLEEIKQKANKESMRWTLIQYTNENYMNIKDESTMSSIKFDMPSIENMSEGRLSCNTSTNNSL